MAAIFTAGGLASGLDTNSIIEQLVKIESQPISNIQSQQSALRSQVSKLGNIASALSSLDTATQSLAKGGALAVTATSSNKTFTATPASGAIAGRYAIEVDQLAQAAKSRSQAFGTATDPVTGGTLHIAAGGAGYDINVSDGEALSDVAADINRSGAPVSAAILSNGTNAYLSLTALNTGYAVGSTPDTALSLTETSTGSQGQPLGFTTIQAATNAKFSVDGLPFERSSNVVANAVPGTTLSLTGTATSPEDLVLSNSADGTAKALQTFVDAYNKVISMVQGQLDVSANTNRSATLAGDSGIRNLQQQLQALTATTVPGISGIGTLAELGVKTNRDGTLSIDQGVLSAAISANPTAVNTIFSQASTGIAAVTHSLVTQETDSVSGILTQAQSSLNGTITSLDNEVTQLQSRVDRYHDSLVQQFTAMEKIVASFKATANFLTQQENAGAPK